MQISPVDLESLRDWLDSEYEQRALEAGPWANGYAQGIAEVIYELEGRLSP